MTPHIPLETPRLVFAPGQWAEMQRLIDRYGLRVNPGSVVGRRYSSTLIIEHLEVGNISRASAETGRVAIMLGDHYYGWNRGYQQALQVMGLQQLGWWMHLEGQPDAELLDELDRVRILEQPEWEIVPVSPKQRPDSLFVTTWLTEEGQLQVRAALIVRETKELKEYEIELNV